MTAFPKKALEQHIAVLGKTGSGKTYAVRGVVEQLLDGRERVCIIDPTGAWYGLRSSASGKSAGFPVVIFGGNHADLPLGGAHGDAIADVVGTSTTPCILDTSLMKVSERTRFFTDFADAIMRKNRGPLHLVIDEAHLFMPQSKVSDPQSGAMMHAGNNMVSGGRSRGLRIILITQRPAKLHKDSLTQVETLIAMKLMSPQDRAAVEAWIEDNADDAKAQEIITSLATLKVGQGWVWAPGLDVLERVTFPRIRTFDSGRAPDGSEVEAKATAPIDLAAISAKLESVSATAVADDPKRLRARIAELERDARAARPAPAVDTQAIEDAAYARATTAVWKQVPPIVEQFRKDLHAAVDAALATYPKIDFPRPTFPSLKGARIVGLQQGPKPVPKANGAPEARYVRGVHRDDPDRASKLAAPELGTGGKRRMLVALAQYPEGMDTRKLSLLTGLSSRSGTWSTYMGQLRTSGWVEGRDHLKITADGMAALGPYEALPSGVELVDYWRGRLGQSGKRAIFDAVVEAYPDTVSIDQVATKTGLSTRSGTWSTYLGNLRTLGLIEGRGDLRASDTLF